MASPIKPRSADTELLITLFARAKPGDMITYEDISKLISKDIRLNRSGLDTALKVVLAEHQLAFECVRKEGYVCLDAKGKVGTMRGVRTRQRNLAKRAVRVLSTVDVRDLSEEDKKAFYANLSLCGTLEHVLKDKQVKKLESHLSSNGSEMNRLAVNSTLNALRQE